MAGRTTPMFDPRDVKVAQLLATIPGGGPVNFAAPANNIASRHRYLLAVTFSIYSAAVSYQPARLEDINGNLLVAASGWIPGVPVVLEQPLVVGVPGANGLRINAGAALPDQPVAIWVQFADVQAPIAPAFAVTI